MRIASTIASLSRFHIVLVAAGGSLVFGWLLTGHFWPLLAAVVAVDWFLVNLANRLVDVPEDRVNQIAATDYAWAHRRGLLAVLGAAYVVSFSVHLLWLPGLLPARLAYHLLGLVYNVRLLPTPRGRRVRLKDLLATKNAASNLGFLLTLIGYPLIALPLAADATPLRVALLVAFFAAFEYSFEVIYDLRDRVGDQVAGVRTWPVVRGSAWASALVVALNVVAVHVALWAAVAGVFGLKDAILALGPAFQLALFAPAIRHGVTPRAAIRITWAFTALLFGYVAWVLAGLPVSLPVRLPVALVAELGLLPVAGMLWWSLRRPLGDRRFWQVYVLIAVSAWLGEQSSISWYGFYHYSPSWTVFLGAVPLAVVLVWPLVVLSVWHLLPHLLPGARPWPAGLRLAAAAFALVFGEALFVEIAGVGSGLWAWEGSGPFGVPWIGLVGWATFGAVAVHAIERGRVWLLALPATGLLGVHGAVLAAWHGGLNLVSYQSLSPGAALAVVAGIVAIGTGVALRHRRLLDLPLGAVPYRIGAAELLYACLVLAAAPASALAAALLFALPYLVLFRWSWGPAFSLGAAQQ